MQSFQTSCVIDSGATYITVWAPSAGGALLHPHPAPTEHLPHWGLLLLFVWLIYSSIHIHSSPLVGWHVGTYGAAQLFALEQEERTRIHEAQVMCVSCVGELAKGRNEVCINPGPQSAPWGSSWEDKPMGVASCYIIGGYHLRVRDSWGQWPKEGQYQKEKHQLKLEQVLGPA